MKYRVFFSMLWVVFSLSNLFPQNTYFIKYKDSVPKSEVESKVTTDSFIPANTDFTVDAIVSSVDHLAKGIAKEDDVMGRIIKVSFTNEVDESQFLQLKNLDRSIEYIQKANVYQMDFVPNDSLLSEQWALDKIQAFDAWDITTGSDTVLLAIIDTGIDYLHPDLHNKIYLNTGEIGTDGNGNDKSNNRIDDDGNGFVDDFRGWDFTDRVGFPFDSSGGDYLGWDNDPMDEQGHGTYIGGIAGAESNNITGVAGVAPNIKLLNLRAFDPIGYGEEDDVAAAILYAVQMHAKVVNMSFGDNSFSMVLRDVIRYAYSKNLVLVGSSGNSGSTAPHYPSGYSEVICVGNSTIDDYVAGNSNYGSTLDLVAPGTSIVTTAMGNNYASINGTSAATPHISAAAALILSLQNFTNEEVKQIIKSTTDDIDEPGWDLRSGAGRLNIYRALSVIAPSVIKFNHPLQDFATLENQIIINATILSPYFESYSLYYGIGFNPNSWSTLIDNNTGQLSNEDIYNLDVTSFADSVYTLRLEVILNNARTMEERVNFYINRTPPVAQLLSVGPAYYGDKTTILAAMYTDEPSLVKMYYRRNGSSEFNFVTLDGFTTNNQFVKQIHYGFIPKQVVEQNSSYEIYFEAENLVGLTTIVKNNGSYFNFSTRFAAEYSGETELPFSLPPGSIFKNPVNLTSQEFTGIYIKENKSLSYPVTSLYSFENNSFTLIDSLVGRLVRDFGDFNNNGLKDVLASLSRDGFVYEQNNSGSTGLTQKFSQEDGSFWPVLAQDIDNDSVTEIIAVKSDTSMSVWNVNNDLSLSNEIILNNFTDISFGLNIIDAANAVIADINGDGRSEIWTVDLDGDIYSYEIFGPNDFREGSIIRTDFIGSAAFLAAGDYDGDGISELAVLLHSIDELDIAPFYRLIVFNLIGENFNIVYDQVLIDAATEFGSSFQQSENSLRFVDLDNDLVDELAVFMFPYAYIFKYDVVRSKVISYKENINSNTIFIGDLNSNSVPEIAFPTSNGIKFYEFGEAIRPSIPIITSAYSDSLKYAELNWIYSTDQYYIYRSTSPDPNTLSLYDSVSTNFYLDINVAEYETYYYAIQAYDPIKPAPLSRLSSPVEVYIHQPAEVDTVFGSSAKSVIVEFSEKMNNTIDNLQAFELVNVGYPNSISPANQYSYLLTFRENIPVGTNHLIVKELKDLYRSPVPVDTVNFEMDSTVISQEFFISSFKIDDSYHIKVVFNLDVDGASVLNTSSYSFDPDNKVTSVSVDSDNKKIIHLSLEGQKPVGSIGKEYVLRISNIRSSVSTGNIEINSGAGSYIVLTSFAQDLSDVYVYPNPVEVGSGSTKLTFANLPRYAKITIWTLDGIRVGEIEENDGNGGVDYELKDLSGNLLGSGVYIYRVVMLDELNNEGEEKIGKFAVIR